LSEWLGREEAADRLLDLMKRLILWDIDGTLIRPNRVGSKAMCRAMEALFGGAGAMSRINMAGMCDWGIWREALAAEGHSAEDVDARREMYFDRYVAELAAILDSPEHQNPEQLPGVRPVLEALSGNDDVVMALLTGNVEAGAWLKLRKVGLDHFFHFGAFGSDAAERSSLPAIAVERAGLHAAGHHFSGKEIVIIGDTVHDIRCGAALGVCAVGVATGPTPAEDLSAAGADHVFDSLEDTSAVLKVLLPPPGGRA
jgi:phosphoglycolate phosphatase